MSRRFILSVALPAVLLVSASLPARASTMPQFDFANPLLVSQVEWGGVIFVVMYIAFAWIGLPRVAGIIATRARTIADNLEQAQRDKQAADEAVAALHAARQMAIDEAQAALADATAHAKQAAELQAAEANARLDADLAQSELRIAATRASGQAALAQAATDTAEDLITRLIGRPAAPGLAQAAVQSALAAGVA